MTGCELRHHLQTLLATTGSEHFFTKYLFVLAKGYEQIAAELAEVLYVKNRTLYSKRQQSAQARFFELRRQAEGFPFGQIFHELIELQRVLKELEEAFEGAHVCFHELHRHVVQFYEAFERFVRSGSDEGFAGLMMEASQLYGALIAARQVFNTVQRVLEVEREPLPGEASLSVHFEHPLRYGAVVQKLAALERGYEVLADLAEVPTAQHPLRIVKIETGSLWICVHGEQGVVGLLAVLLERFAGFVYSRYAVDDGPAVLSERVSATQTLVNLVDELERARLGHVVQDEPRLRQAALTLRRLFLTLLAEAPSLCINGVTLAVPQASQARYGRQSVARLRELTVRPASVPESLQETG